MINTISLFDYCHEIRVPVVNYSSNYDTAQRWIKSKLKLDKIVLSLFDIYYIVKPQGYTKESILCRDGSLLSATIPLFHLNVDFSWLISQLYYNFKIVGDYKIDFYCSLDRNEQLICGIEFDEDD